MDDLQRIMRPIIDQMTTRCLLRWNGGARQGATLREHCMAYFQVNEFALKGIRHMAATLGTDAPRVETVYRAMVDASRMKWEQYSDAEAQQVLDDWFKPKPPSN